MSILTILRAFIRTFMFGLILSLVHLTALSAAENLTHEYQLSNGMKVIIKEDHRAPTVAHMVWYRAGSIDEVTGKTGVAHVLEHMMFKGTKTLKPGDFSKKVAEVGGKDNAFTSKDYTAYFQQIEKTHLPKMMALEADRMLNLQISEEEFLKEIQVVMEERRLRTDDQASAVVYEQLMAAAFANSPYKNPIIGWMGDLNSMTYLDAMEWYRTWYAPNNAVLVVTGDVSPTEVLTLAEKYYGSIPKKSLPIRKPLEEIQQIGVKRIQVKAPAENPNITLAWKVPKLSGDDLNNIEPYALDVLSAVLDGHPNSRLNKIMVHDSRIADHVSASYDLSSRGPQLFLIEGSPAKGRTVDELERVFKKILMDIRQYGVTDAELNRIKSQILAAQIYKRDSVFGQAMEIGSIEMDGISWKNLDHILEMTQKVNSKDIQAVVEKYLIDDDLTVAVLDPQPINRKVGNPVSLINGLRH